MKIRRLLGIIVVFLLCSGCASKIEPIHTETRNFDLDTAAEMVLKMEENILDLAARSSVTRPELNEITREMESVFHDHGGNIVETFFDVADIENEALKSIDAYPYNFYPTAYHQGVEITEANVNITEYEDAFFDHTFLHIREEYTGDNTLLEGFYREYVFEMDGDDWVFYSLGGTANYQGEVYHAGVLALK